MSVEKWSESIGRLLDSLPTLGYSDPRASPSDLLALCFGDTVEIL
jgi:hypothetical protein